MSWIPSRMRRVAMVGFFGMLLLVSWRTWARPLGLLEPSRPQPDVLNLRYGPFDRNVMDVWKAKSKSGDATPLVVFFHGGGFRSGDKSIIPPWLISKCLEAGVSVASANYRLSQTAPFPAPMHDGARRDPIHPISGQRARNRSEPNRGVREFGGRGHRALGWVS